MKKTLLLVLSIIVIAAKSFGQTDPVLFTVNNVPVHLSEFNYIYTKTNGAKADFSKTSVEEYLDLYTKFKMKVARAKDMKLDTIPSLQEELAGYRRQLADSYLTDKEVTEKLVKEAHGRIQKDISISHILFKVNKTDTLAAYNQAKAAKARLVKGENFEVLAKEVSQDDNSKATGGFLGFLTALLPEGFYQLENAMYTTPVGKSSDIVRSPLGYHIVKVNEDRPARGEIEVAHIMIRKKKEGVVQPLAAQKIDSLYTLLKSGSSTFETIALQNSEDANSANKGGYLGFFGIGRYELPFENAAFALTKDGEYTAIIESTIGYHIIKRISRKGIESYENMKTRLKSRIQQDSRFELSKQAMVERIKRENTFVENTLVLNDYVSKLDSTFLTFSWKTPETSQQTELFRIGNKPTSLVEFAVYLANNPNRRLSYAVNFKNDVPQITRAIYKEFIDEQALAFEETQLDKKYVDFKNLMREYEEGILLFEAIKMNVWDKASQDTLGLEKFHNAHKDKYMWAERAQLVTYTVSDSAKMELDAVLKYAEKHSPQDVLKKFNKNKEIVSFSSETVEKGKTKANELPEWKVGAATKIQQNAADKTWHVTKIDKLLSPTAKSLKEARGFVVADYQEYLEKKWMEELTAKYKVDVKKDVLKSIVK